MAHAKRIVNAQGVQWADKIDDEKVGFGAPETVEDQVRVQAEVRDDARTKRKQDVILDVDLDGRVQYAHCSCSFFKRDKLRKGPCAHILAAAVLASEQVALQQANKDKKPTNAVDPELFKGKVLVFTGALTLFTRDQAEELARQYGGTASGSVSKNTSYLIAGDKAGSKLAKAQQLGVPILTETQFQAMIQGKTI